MNEAYKNFFNSLKGKRIMICGLGISNIHLIPMLSGSGAQVIACDARDKDGLSQETLDILKSEAIEYRLGPRYMEKLDADIIIRAPGMNFFSEALKRARSLGIVVTSEMEIFFNLCPCKIIGITGSDGKTTVTTVISEILKISRERIHIGGNIGIPLLPRISDIKEGDIAVVELSSFQLMSMKKSPQVAVITNISPNHLDVHKDMKEYIDAKKNIILYQNSFDRAVLNYDNNITHSLAKDTKAEVIFFSSSKKVDKGVWVDKDGNIVFSYNGSDACVMNRSDIKIPGEYNLQNYLATVGAVWDIVKTKDIAAVAKSFGGVEHRMELVRKVNGVSYYNDSIASSPTRTISGCLSLFGKRIILIAGGYDKKLPFDKLGQEIAKKVKILILMGETSHKIEQSVKKASSYCADNIKVILVKDMKAAVEVINQKATYGDIAVLSPACASFDLYKNFEERGKHFKSLVRNIC